LCDIAAEKDVSKNYSVNSNNIDLIQATIFDLMCNELQRRTKNLKKHNLGERTKAESDEGEQCYELLYLFYLLGGNSSRHKSLSNPLNVKSLVSILGTNSAPRSQGLVFRLCRRLLPLQNISSIESITNLLIDEVGKSSENLAIEGRELWMLMKRKNTYLPIPIPNLMIKLPNKVYTELHSIYGHKARNS
jgi:hypothetical protein